MGEEIQFKIARYQLLERAEQELADVGSLIHEVHVAKFCVKKGSWANLVD